MSSVDRVLIVDDDDGTRETLVDILRAKRYAVEVAARGREALERLRAEPVDVAVVDIRLPDVSGLELLAALKEVAPEIEVIFITGHASLTTAIQAIDGAAFAYLVKPVELEHLLATLEKALEKQRLERALRESEERYRLITDHISDAVFLLDPEGRLVFANPRVETLSGYRLDELAGQTLLSRLFPDDARAARAHGEAAGGGAGRSPHVETELQRKDGDRLWVEITFTTIRKAGGVIGHLGVARDVSERKRAEEILLQREKLAAMGSLLAGVAHELNNPLAVVLGQAQLLAQEVTGGPVSARVERIAQAAERCVRIVKNFLALARERPTERRSVDLNQVVREALELLLYALRVDDVEVVLDLAGDLPALRADPNQLHQVVVNLVTNAHQAMRATAPPRRLRLTTRCDPAAGRVTLEVGDTGPGIPPDLAVRVFEPFFTTKPAGQGTGLGLALCQGIVEAHGGRIRGQSAPGPGAVFHVELPTSAPSPAMISEVPGEALAPLRGQAILVVDDEPAVAGVLAELLAVDGHDVETAPSGREALRRLATRAYDLVLTDMKMPDLDGPGLYREAARRHPDVARRFVFLTGDTLTRETTVFLETTGAPSLAKPFTLAEIRQVLRRAIAAPRPA